MNITDIRGIGPKKAELLKKLNIHNVEDFLYSLPRGYQDRSKIKRICDIENGETVIVTATVVCANINFSGYGKKQILKVKAEDKTGRIEISFFNAKYLKNAIKIGEMYDFYGKTQVIGNKKVMIHPEFEKFEGDEKHKILPIYPLTAGLSQNDVRKWHKIALDLLLIEDKEYLPQSIIKKHNLCFENYALKNIHFPENRQKFKEAKYRLIYDELFLLQIGMMLLRSRSFSKNDAPPFSKDISTKEYVDSLMYELTNAQKRVVAEIEKDLESTTPMNRLLQGDVGSGKTVIAQIALYKTVKNGFQGALMAPTEILAKQHYKSLEESYKNFDIKVGFLSGNITVTERRKILEGLKQGEIDILIGTHAIIQPDIEFKNLGLVITDEQHRFGVKQRAALLYKGRSPHTLVMTATPIPRTLAVILYGDLDISIIDELPPGRQPIKTIVADNKKRDSVYEFVFEQIKKGRQAYVVTPLIEESEVLDVKSSEEVFDELSTKFRQYNIALLHGSMKQSQKDEIMTRFNAGEIDLLVSTVVIEVGINVPNSTVMVIENSERFGLAQLHQLRGRVGRGNEKSYCFLINEGKSKISIERASIMENSIDGFVIAEKDLELRGPGEIFGTKQHGIPELKIADLSKYGSLLPDIKSEIKEILEEDPNLLKEENQNIKKRLKEFFPEIGKEFLIIT